jgi:integrase/recombinase XerC
MIEDQISDFLQYLKFEKRYSNHTQSSYSKDLSQFQQYIKGQFGIEDITSVSHFHVRSWLASFKEDGLVASSINRKLSALNSLFKFMLRKQVVTKNPLRQLHAMRLPERLPSYLKEDETHELLEEVQFEEGFKGFTDRLICDMLYQLGLRRSELVNLKEKDIEWSLAQVRILGKGNKERLVPLNPGLMEDLKAYIEEKRKLEGADSERLLVLETGKPVYGVYVYRVVNDYLNGKGSGDLKPLTSLSKKSPHVMRHSFATHLLNNGANIQAIKDLLGHSSLAATQVYTHNNIDKLKEIHKTAHPRG